MTFILERVHSISIYTFLCICWHDTETTEIVPVRFIPECVRHGLQRNSRSSTKFNSECHVNWKRTSLLIENRKSCCLGRMAHAHLTWREKPPERERLRQSRSILSCECSTSFTLARNSFRNHYFTTSLTRPVRFYLCSPHLELNYNVINNYSYKKKIVILIRKCWKVDLYKPNTAKISQSFRIRIRKISDS